MAEFNTLGNCYRLKIDGRVVGYFANQDSAVQYVNMVNEQREAYNFSPCIVEIDKHYLEGFHS